MVALRRLVRRVPGRRRNIAEVVAVPAGPNAYNSLWQVRTDAWSTLEESTAQLALAGAQQRPVEQLTDTVAGALDVLTPIERFWAFPRHAVLLQDAPAVRDR
jgi:hypothetical protein